MKYMDEVLFRTWKVVLELAGGDRIEGLYAISRIYPRRWMEIDEDDEVKEQVEKMIVEEGC